MPEWSGLLRQYRWPTQISLFDAVLNQTSVNELPSAAGGSQGYLLVQYNDGSTESSKSSKPGDFQTATITAPDRIPIFNTKGEKSITITPDTKKTPMDVTITIKRKEGSGTKGAATFDDGETEKTLSISEATTVTIKGTEHSDAKNNMEISVTVAGKEAGKKSFSVRTWPTNFRFGDGGGQNGVLALKSVWDSESGDVADLHGIAVGEKVTYNKNFPQPPYANGAQPQNPTEIEVDGSAGEIGDQHLIPCGGFQKPYSADVTDSEQYYYFTDSVMTDAPPTQNLQGPNKIEREIYLHPTANKWMYRVKKGEHSSSKFLPDQP